MSDANKALVLQMIPDFDAAPIEAISKWMRPDYSAVINGEPPIDLNAYREMVGAIAGSFSNIRHEVHDMVAEGDRVAVAMTLHMTHTGEFEGIAATGRAVRIAEMAIMQVRDGKIASERLVVDLAALTAQISAK